MFVFCQFGPHTRLRDIDSDTSVCQLLKSLKVNPDSSYVICNGRKVEEGSLLQDGATYHLVPRVLGGKGGFGSMLRAIGAQIEKTTSREACRDLSGRRMRDVNNEKKLKEWLSKESDRETEREERRQERLARRMAGPKHNFDDPEYHKQRSKVQEDLDDALQKGLKRAKDKSSDSPSTSQSGPAKKMKSSNKEWLGMDIDSDDLESDSDNEANPGSPTMKVDDGGCGDTAGEGCSADAAERVGEEREEQPMAKGGDGEDCDSNNKEVQKDEGVDSAGQAVAANGSSGASDTPMNEELVRSDEPVDLDQVTAKEELVAMGMERLKNALMTRGLKCGGALEERAERLFQIKGLSPDQIPSCLKAKSKGGGKKSKSK